MIMNMPVKDFFSDVAGSGSFRVHFNVGHKKGAYSKWVRPARFLIFTVAIEIDWYGSPK